MIRLKGLLCKKDIISLLRDSSDKEEVLYYLTGDKNYRYCISSDLNNLLIAIPDYSPSVENVKRINCSGLVIQLSNQNNNWSIKYVYSLPIEELKDLSLFGRTIEMSRDGKIVFITSNDVINKTNTVHVYNSEGNRRQVMVGLQNQSFGNILILSKNKKQLLISDYLRSGVRSEDEDMGVIDIYNLSSNDSYVLYQSLSSNIPYDNFGQTIYTNYDFDISFNKLNKIISLGDFSHINEFRLIKDKWVKI